MTDFWTGFGPAPAWAVPKKGRARGARSEYRKLDLQLPRARSEYRKPLPRSAVVSESPWSGAPLPRAPGTVGIETGPLGGVRSRAERKSVREIGYTWRQQRRTHFGLPPSEIFEVESAWSGAAPVVYQVPDGGAPDETELRSLPVIEPRIGPGGGAGVLLALGALGFLWTRRRRK